LAQCIGYFLDNSVRRLLDKPSALNPFLTFHRRIESRFQAVCWLESPRLQVTMAIALGRPPAGDCHPVSPIARGVPAMIRKIAILLAISCLPVADGTAAGQEALSDQFYGSGVHRYFSGDINAALTDFSAAIQAGTDDPRPYYFRALTWMRMGRSAEAYADLKKGSDLESADINSTYQVSKALERVQGSLRMQLERYRMQARALAQQRQAQERRERYEATRRFDAQQVRRAGALEERQPPAAARNAEAFNEFAAPDRLPGDSLGSAPAAAAQLAPLGRGTPAPPPAATGTSPFGPPAGVAPGAATEGSNPFGQPPAAAAPAANTPLPATATPAENESPFGGASPFGPAPMPAENNIEKRASPAPSNPPPAAEPTANGGANPFGAAIDQPPAAQPAGSPPPATDGGANPFGTAAGEPRAAASRVTPVRPAVDDANPSGSGAGQTPAAAEPAGAPPIATDSTNPFGAAAAPPPAAAASPAAGSPAAADANPFGGAAPPAASESPFGGAARAAQPGNTANDADSNPFGPADNNAAQGDASAAPPADNPFGSSNAAPAANPADATAAPPATGVSAAPPRNSAAATSSGGFFRALRRATGIDAAIDAAGSTAQSLPVGRAALPMQPNNRPREGQPVDASTALSRGTGARAPQAIQPQGNAPLRNGGTPQQPAAAANSDPFQIPPAPAGNTPAADNPFGDAGAPATGAPANPFGAPGGEMPNGPAANTPNPFEDDAVQPAPANGAR
jgi:hypothetical protein